MLLLSWHIYYCLCPALIEALDGNNHAENKNIKSSLVKAATISKNKSKPQHP